MENTTRLLDRHADTLSQRHWALVEADDPASVSLPGLAYVHADKPLAAGVHVAMLPELPAGVDLLVLVLPKSGERLTLLLASLAGQLAGDTELWLVGPARGGIKGGITRLKAQAAGVRVLDSARHCKLVSGVLSPRLFHLPDWRRRFTVTGFDQQPLEICSYPGAFNHGSLDEGTALLLDTLAEAQLHGEVLDMGCGAGVISAVLAKAGCTVTAVDVSATAVTCCRETLADNHLLGDVHQGDLYAALDTPVRFRHLVTNPPFHDGSARTLEITRRLIAGAPAHMLSEATLWLVANQGLAYQDWLEEQFRNVQVVAQTRRFRVYRAMR